MNVKKPASARALKSNVAKLDAHTVKRGEYQDLPEITDEMLSRAVVKKGGRPVSANPRKLVALRMPSDLLALWKATGKGWQTRMVQRLSKVS